MCQTCDSPLVGSAYGTGPPWCDVNIPGITPSGLIGGPGSPMTPKLSLPLTAESARKGRGKEEIDPISREVKVVVVIRK